MDVRVTVDIEASPQTVWSVLHDVERWPEWTASVTSIRRFDAGPLAVGSRALVRQPKLPDATYGVTELEENRNFIWVSARPGVRVTGGHWIEPRPGGSRATLSLAFKGLLGPVVARLTSSLTQRYVQMEANGLKARSEELQRAIASPPASA
jgi:uncharacterized membrane protein